MKEKRKNLIIGKSGSGKTRGILFNDVQSNIGQNSVIFLDNKLEYFHTFSESLISNGYEIKVLNLRDGLNSNGWNPLSLPYKLYQDGNKDLAIDLVNIIARCICVNPNSNSDPFWELTASSYFTGLTLFLFKEAKEDEINLGSIATLINSSEANLSYLKEYLDKLDPMDPIYMSLSTTLFAPPDTRMSIVSVLRQKIYVFITKENQLNLLCSDDINIIDSKKQAIFIVGGSSDFLPNRLIAGFINQVILNIGSLNQKYDFVLDNFENIPSIVDVNSLLEYADTKDLKVYIANKDVNEFKQSYGNYILSRFDDVNEVTDITNVMDVGKYNTLPKLNKVKHNYFNLKVKK